MAGLKVRLEDGSEVGPLDLRMVQTWYQQGLIGPDAMVQRPGNPRWVRLSESTDLREWGPAPRLRAGHGAAAGKGGPPANALADAGEGRWRLHVASALFFVLALGAVLCAVWPERVRPELDGTPWVRIALGLAALGLALVPGWEWGRRGVRVATLLAAAATFPLAGLFAARGMRGEALLVLGSAALLAAGLVALLAPGLSRLLAAGCLALVLLGGAGLVRYLPAAPGTVAAVASWASGETRVVNAEVGLTLPVPPGWVALKTGNPLVAAPAAGAPTFAQPRVSGHAFLVVEPPPAGVAALEHYLDHVIAQRKTASTSFDEYWRRDGRLGAVASRRASTRRGSPEGRFLEHAIVARDGDRYLALVAWAPEAGGGRALDELEALEAAVSLPGVREAGRRAAVQAANLALPHLSVGAIQKLVASQGAAAPAELFRRSVAASADGLSSLGPSGAEELQALTASALGALSREERARLAGYLGRVAARQPTAPEEDEQMRLLMKGTVERLPAPRRTRLGELNEAAIGAALARP
jgi:hypothetical protein